MCSYFRLYSTTGPAALAATTHFVPCRDPKDSHHELLITFPETIQASKLACSVQEYFLIALSQPRQEVESSCSSSSEDSEGEEPNVVGGTDSPAVRMMRKSMMFQQEQKQIREEAITQKRRTFRLPVCHSPLGHHVVICINLVVAQYHPILARQERS